MRAKGVGVDTESSVVEEVEVEVRVVMEPQLMKVGALLPMRVGEVMKAGLPQQEKTGSLNLQGVTM